MSMYAKKIYSYIGGINGLLLIFYSVFIFTMDLITGEYLFWGFSMSYFLSFFIFIIVLSVIICPMVLRFLSKSTIAQHSPTLGKSDFAIIRSIAFYLLPFSLLLIYYITYYPGAFPTDPLNQLSQAVSSKYNDWHPVLHTLLIYKTPLTLTGGWIGSIVLFQIICISAVLGYTFNVIYKYTNAKYTVLSMLFVLLNPQLGNISMFPWKDISFGIGALLLLTFSLQIYISKGSWLNTPLNLILFIITAVFTTLFRHNAILFTAPLIIAVLFFTTKKQGLIICLSVAALCLGIKYPFYSALGVEQPNQRQVETLGLPMTVIGAAVTYTPEVLDEEVLEFAYSIVSKEVWEQEYQYGDYNTIKFLGICNNEIIEQYGAKKVISMMFKCFQYSPKVSTTALIELTKPIYTVSDEYNIVKIPFLNANYSNITDHSQKLFVILRNYSDFASANFSHLFSYLGIMHFLLIASILSKCKLSKPTDKKQILFIFPVFSYNWCTSFLLTAASDSVRFFFYTFTLIPVLLIFLYRNDDERGMGEKALIAG